MTRAPISRRDSTLGARLRRRAITIPAVLTALVVGVISLPLLLSAAVVVDLVSGRRWSTVRVLLFGLAWLAYEAAGLAVAAGLWVVTGFGLLARTRPSLTAHHRLQAWWTRGLSRAAEKLIGLRFSVTGGAVLDAPGPLLVFGRHGSQGDAVLSAAVLGGEHGLRLRYVVKRQLLWDPCLDVVGHRLPNYFVDRDALENRFEVESIGRLARHMRPDEALVMFPEGTRFSQAKLERAIDALADVEPDRVEAARALRRVLPLRTTGALAVLRNAPDADIVILNHVGVDDFGSLGQMWRNVPLPHPISMRLDRIERSAVPTLEDEGKLIAYLDERWAEVDQWVEDQERARPQ